MPNLPAYLLYRLYVISPNGLIDTGRADASDPHQFGSEEDMYAYATERGEIPVFVASVAEVAQIVAGNAPIPGTLIYVPQPGTAVPTGTNPTPGNPTGGPVDTSENGPLPDVLIFTTPLAFIGTIPVAAAGGPVVAAAVTIASIVATIFTFFGQGINNATKRALNGLAGAIANVAHAALVFSNVIARALGKVIGLLGELWNKVIQPILRELNKLASKVVRVLDKIIAPILQHMERIREIVMAYYVKVIVPLLDMVQKIRKALGILRILHVPGVKKVDDKLRQIEAKLIAPISAILGRLNEHSWFLNLLLNTRLLLSQPLFGWSVHEYSKDVAAILWDSQTPKERDLPTVPPPPDPVATAARVRDNFVTLANTGGGQMALEIASGKAAFATYSKSR